MNEAAQLLGRIGGRSQSPSKRQAAACNAVKARDARQAKLRRVHALDGSLVSPEHNLTILRPETVKTAVQRYLNSVTSSPSA